MQDESHRQEQERREQDLRRRRHIRHQQHDPDRTQADRNAQVLFARAIIPADQET
ncbi:hypothetical protein D3C81_1651100 [compost metagenome]